MRKPDYQGGGLVNLVAELEHRLTGRSSLSRLRPALSRLLPIGRSYVLLLFDGLGDAQLSSESSGTLRRARLAVLDAPFPTTTSVSLASVATGLSPAGHGLLGYQLWLPELGQVVNTLKWTTLWGDQVDYPFRDLLPSPNLWERLSSAGIEAITVQPGGFLGTPLSSTLYRGVRFEPVFTAAEMAETCLDLVAESGRLVFVYLPHVDVAAHTAGQDSDEYREALRFVSAVWEGVTSRLPDGTVAVGTADHGHMDVPDHRRREIPLVYEQDLTFYGDSRVVFVRGDPGAAEHLARILGEPWVSLDVMQDWWGPGSRHPSFGERVPVGALVAGPGRLILHRFSDRRLVGAHGGLTEEELRVPLLVKAGRHTNVISG